MEQEKKFIRPLSLEAIGALLLALINLALDQADIHIMLISWFSVFACIALCVDALRRTEWFAQKGGYYSRHFAASCTLITILFISFGIFLSIHKKSSIESENRSSVSADGREKEPHQEHATLTAEAHVPSDPPSIAQRLPLRHQKLAAKITPKLDIHRAYLYKVNVQFTNDENIVQAAFKNESEYPALEVTTQTEWIILNPEFDITTYQPQFTPAVSVGDVAPRLSIAANCPSLKEQNPLGFSQAKDGTASAYLFGKAAYKDNLGNTYEPRFCVRYNHLNHNFEECPRNSFVSGEKP